MLTLEAVDEAEKADVGEQGEGDEERGGEDARPRHRRTRAPAQHLQPTRVGVNSGMRNAECGKSATGKVRNIPARK